MPTGVKILLVIWYILYFLTGYMWTLKHTILNQTVAKICQKISDCQNVAKASVFYTTAKIIVCSAYE